MKFTKIKSCYIGPEISPEQFIPEHFFIYLIKGSIEGYDGHKHYSMKSGEACIVCKNHLARYTKQKQDDEFEKIVIIFDEDFLKQFQKKHPVTYKGYFSKEAFMKVNTGKWIPQFLQTLDSYHSGNGKIDERTTDQARETLLQLILKLHPEYADVFFDFGKPGKLDLEAFMNKHYKFNVSIQRFAFLTGRSLSAFKRDFGEIFKETPSRWLISRRLQEAYFLIKKKRSKPNDFYVDLGFEDLSHFSFAFKKQFGLTPTELLML